MLVHLFFVSIYENLKFLLHNKAVIIKIHESISPITKPITAISIELVFITQNAEITYTILTLIICSISCVIEGIAVFFMA